MEELAKKIEQILDQFFRECAGNRLNSFSMLSLKEILLKEIRNHKPIKSEVMKDDKK